MDAAWEPAAWRGMAGRLRPEAAGKPRVLVGRPSWEGAGRKREVGGLWEVKMQDRESRLKPGSQVLRTLP